ncbi:hypothetical protein [Niabella hibiscisoli]|uniref:hypothetical protein n=1 Tax=Niabella hibiscisoli TaxID=1825928 RepID=UPI001F0EFB64|nr:hypothetical protein [Niabella hibiscisoli]MCH5715705.1 hypothetical protein [Niabella hibiscisoli]
MSKRACFILFAMMISLGCCYAQIATGLTGIRDTSFNNPTAFLKEKNIIPVLPCRW